MIKMDDVPLYDKEEKKHAIEEYNEKSIVKNNKLKLVTTFKFNIYKFMSIFGIIFLIFGCIALGIISFTVYSDGTMLNKIICGNTTVNVPECTLPNIPSCPTFTYPTCINNCSIVLNSYNNSYYNNTYINQTNST
jgi:hypothetical protein